MRFYLDHAATSWPKPPGVIQAASDFYTQCGASAGRGIYSSAIQAEQVVDSTRRLVRELINAQFKDEIAFCSNGTHALNVAIFGIALGALERGEPAPHIVTTHIEHNSVLRPLALAESRGWLTFSQVPCDATGSVPIGLVKEAIRPETRWLIVNHASNVTGSVQSLDLWSELAKRLDLKLMVDAAQTLGYLPIDVQKNGISILAAPGHKGLGALVGSGFLYAARTVQSELGSFLIGGTGSKSDQVHGPFPWAETVESGNLDTAAIASLGRAIQWHQKEPMPILQDWSEQILETIADCESIEVVGSTEPSLHTRLPVFSIVPAAARSQGQSAPTNEASLAMCQEWAAILDSAMGIECRAGFHCASSIHQFIGTGSCGGTLRLSLGNTTTQEDVDAACQGIRMLAELD